MPLKYSIYRNPFRKKEFIATVRPRRIYDLEEVLEEMAGSSRRYSCGELREILYLFIKTVASILVDGSHIHLPFLKITTSIRGKFTGKQDKFSHARHKVNINANPGKTLKAVAADITVQKVQASRPKADISQVYDFAHETHNQTLTAGGLAEVQGTYLKINTVDAQQGIFLTMPDQADIRITQLYQNTPSRLMFVVPTDIPAGMYQLSVRTTVGNSTEIRTGVAKALLQVIITA